MEPLKWKLKRGPEAVVVVSPKVCVYTLFYFWFRRAGRVYTSPYAFSGMVLAVIFPIFFVDIPLPSFSLFYGWLFCEGGVLMVMEQEGETQSKDTIHYIQR